MSLMNLIATNERVHPYSVLCTYDDGRSEVLQLMARSATAALASAAELAKHAKSVRVISMTPQW